MSLRWGILGPGRIAETVASQAVHVENGRFVAVGSRSLDRATAFAERHRLPQAYGSYAELLASDEIDAVYLATPHAQHTELALDAIAAGKHLLVEKAFTTTLADTERVVEAARSAGTFLMEGMWTRFLPAIGRVRALVDDQAIGEVRAVQGDLFAFRSYDPADRLFNPDLGGGAVLDLGVYALSFVQQFLGQPDLVHAAGGLLPNGVEGEAAVLLGWEDGRVATEAFGFTTPGPGRQILAGTAGWIEVKPRFHRADTIGIHLLGEEPVEEYLPAKGIGYAHEFEHVGRCIAEGLTESPVMPLSDTVAVQRLMAEVQRQLR